MSDQNSFFVLTNLIMTKNQTETKCAEIPNEVTICSSDESCTAGIISSRSNGVQTGKCVNFSDTVKTCEIFAWCPLEIDDKAPDPPVLTGTENLTVLVRNNIRFRKFDFIKRNILPHVDKHYLERCVFNRSTDPSCPNFRLKDIVQEAGEDFQTMAIHGGVMGFQIRWDCDLDKDESLCVPQYKFRRIDKYSLIGYNSIKTGYNFRYAEYNNTGRQKTRTLIKAYGIRFDIMVFGQAGKFSIIPTLSNVGAGLGLLGLVTLLCDLVVLNCFPQRKDYREHKYSKFLKVSGDENPPSSQHEQNPQQEVEINDTEEVA
ncbi:P2X purinoceptor 4-like [Sardina pilchardus]|uniref:P2X purinoceptor 4-like n=1 Tax=Sardina pilchardus TaxID=27697 RepID=UPI002E0FFF39